MRRHSFAFVTLLPIWLTIGSSLVKAQTSATPANAIETTIRAQADAFVVSFAKRDAAALAAQWTPDGIYINENGEHFVGREAIQAEYEKLFQVCPDNLALRIEVDSVQPLNADTVLEEGRSALTPQPPGEPRVMSSYAAIHVKRDGNWLMANVRDSRIELPPEPGHLEDLEWLVGTWSATSNGATIDVKCRWVDRKQFLFRTQTVSKAGKVTFEGLEVIGRDPSTGQITSWSFTSDGGHAVGVWSPLDGSWRVASFGVLDDGMETSAVYTYTRTEDDQLVWKSEERMVGDATVPDLPPITLARRP